MRWLFGWNVGSDISPVVCVGEGEAWLGLSIWVWLSIVLQLVRFDFNVGVLVDGCDMVRLPFRRVGEVCKCVQDVSSNRFQIGEW